MKFTLYIVMIACLALVSCSTADTRVDYDRSINFSKYKTFALYKQGLDSLKLNDLDKKRVINSLISNLEQKGLKLSEKQPDLLINVGYYTKERTTVSNAQSPSLWGYNPWMYPNNQSYNQYDEGTIIIDFVDRSTNQLVWEALGTGFDVSRIDKKEELIPNIVEKMLYKYPPN